MSENIKDEVAQNVVVQLGNLINEYKNFRTISQENLDSMTTLTSFFEACKSSKETERQSNEAKIESILKSIKETPSLNKSVLSQSITSFYEKYNESLDKSKKLSKKIQIDIIDPLKSFRESLRLVYNEQLKNFSQITNKFRISQCFLQSSRVCYLCSNYSKEKFEKEGIKGQIFDGDTEESKLKKMEVTKIKGLANNSEQIYQYEIVKYNKIMSEINESYNKLMVSMQQNEESRTYFIKSSLDKFKNYIEEINKINIFLQNEITNLMSADMCKQEINECLNRISKNMISKNDDVNQQSQKIRFVDESFTSYKDYIIKVNNNFDENLLKVQYLPEELLAKNVISEKEQNDLINKVLDELFKEQEIPKEDIAEIIDNMKNSKLDNFMKKFLDALLDKRKTGVKFLNLNNLQHLANIICFISLTNPSIDSGKFELNFKILFVSERIYYEDIKNNNKVYLCALLSLNNYYRTKYFWKDIIELKLANKLTDHIKRITRVKLEDEKSNSFFSKIGNKLGFNNDIKKNSLVYNTRIRKYIKNYDLVEIPKIEFLDKIASTDMSVIIKDAIPNLANFNFPSEEALDMIAELSEQYRVPKDYINYYVSYYNVSCCSIRKALPISIKSSSDRRKRFQSSIKNRDELLVKVLGYSLKYLDNKDYFNVLLLSKNINKKVSKKIYNMVLRKKNITKNIRIGIWKQILNVSQIQKEYNYQEILKKVTPDKCSKRDEIEMDILRTYVGDIQNVEEVKKKISNILRAISESNGEIKYCQGMNYISEFILEYTQNEEESFYIFLAFFKNTEYPLIFEKDLKKLRVFFYVFQRIINLFEPELSSYFNSNSVNVNYFMPPWFITLFLSSRQFINQKEVPIVLIRIIDNFLISGWKAVMKVGVHVLHFFEKELMGNQYEDMLQFLINDLLKYDFFHDKNLDRFEKFFDETKITKKLIKNIETEFLQDEMIHKAEGK